VEGGRKRKTKNCNASIWLMKNNVCLSLLQSLLKLFHSSSLVTKNLASNLHLPFHFLPTPKTISSLFLNSFNLGKISTHVLSMY
jgi:hypothetical protein